MNISSYSYGILDKHQNKNSNNRQKPSFGASISRGDWFEKCHVTKHVLERVNERFCLNGKEFIKKAFLRGKKQQGKQCVIVDYKDSTIIFNKSFDAAITTYSGKPGQKP